MADTERRTTEERWATFSGAILGITVLAAALTGSVRTVFLGVVSFLTVGCIYGFARTFTPTRAFENTVKRTYQEWKWLRHPYWCAYQHFQSKVFDMPQEDVVFLFRMSSNQSSSLLIYPEAAKLKLRCEMNRLFHKEKALCIDRRNLIDVIAVMCVPTQFLETKNGVTILQKGRYSLRWYNEETGAFIMKQRIRSWGHDPHDGSWRKFRDRLSAELKKLRGQEVPTDQSATSRSQTSADQS
jgi:hypothetical protein